METEFRARFDETYVNLQLHRSPSLCIDSQNLRVTSNVKTFPWTNLENSSRPRCQQLVTKWTVFARMYIRRTRGDLPICENDGPFLDFTREIKGTRLIRLNEFISNLHRYPRRSFSRFPRGSRVGIPRMWKLLQHPESCVKTNQGLSLSLSLSLPICLHGCTVASVRVNESRRLAWMHVINGTRIAGTRRVRTDWGMPVNWSESWRWSSFVEEASSVQDEARKLAGALERRSDEE